MVKESSQIDTQEFVDDEDSNIGIGFTSKEGVSKRDLVMEALRDCRQKRAQEMKRGYFNTKFDKQGNTWKVWIPDTREEYINSIRALSILLTGDFDSDYKTKKKVIEEKGNEAFKKYGWKIFKTKRVPQKDVYQGFSYQKEYTGEIIMPTAEEDDMIDIDSKGKSKKVSWKANEERYMQTLVLIYDELFSEIVLLLERRKYLQRKRKFG